MGSSIFPTNAPSRSMPEAAEMGTNVFGKTFEQIARDTPKYAFTEFITLKFRPGIQLEEDTTNEGRIWANTVKAYLEQNGVGPLWWGRTAEERDTVQLVVEWCTTLAYQVFHSSPTYHEIEAALQPILLTPSTSKRFVLPKYSGTRENALSSLFIVPSYTAIYTWTSPPSFVTSALDSTGGSTHPQTTTWEQQWQAFASKAMYSEKCVYNSSASGWEVGDDWNSEEHGRSKEFCGLLRWADIEGHKAYIDGMRDEFRKGNEPSGPNETPMTLEMKLCHVQFRSLKNGWLGSVVKEQPDVKYPNGLFKQQE